MRKRIKSFGYAYKGIRSVFSTETNMKIHIVISLLVIAGGFIFNISAYEWLICLACMGMVIGFEMTNTALETLVNHISPGYHETAGKIKDIAAGAVLISAIFSAIIGLIIFVPKGWEAVKCFFE